MNGDSWGNTVDEQASPDVRESSNWSHPYQNAGHTNRQSGVTWPNDNGDFVAKWQAKLPISPSRWVMRPIVTTDKCYVGVDSQLFGISLQNGSVDSIDEFAGTIGAAAYDSTTDTLVANSGPLVVDCTSEAEASSDSKKNSGAKPGDSPPDKDSDTDTGEENLSGSVTEEGTEQTESGQSPQENQDERPGSGTDSHEDNRSSDATDQTLGQGETKTDATREPVDETTEAVDANTVYETQQPDSSKQENPVSGTVTTDTLSELNEGDSRVTQVVAFDGSSFEKRWQRTVRLGYETAPENVLATLAADRFYLPHRPKVTEGGAGRNVGQIGGLDPETGERGGYIAYPYQDFNSSPMSAPAVEKSGDFLFQGGGNSGEVVRVGTLVSRPKWQSYVGVPVNAQWQAMVWEEIAVVPGADDEIVTVEMESGDVRWNTGLDNNINRLKSRVLTPNRFVFTDGQSEIRALDISDGKTAWTLALDDDDGDKECRALIASKDMILAAIGPRCVALDPDDGTKRGIKSVFDEEPIVRLAITESGLLAISESGTVCWHQV